MPKTRMKSTVIRITYNPMAKVLHWLLALMIFSEYFIGLTLSKTGWRFLHVQLGCLILALVIYRIIWRSITDYPGQDQRLSRVQQLGAKLAHYLLYLLMLAILIVGLVLVFTKGVPVTLLGIHFEPLMAPMEHAKRHKIHELHVYLAHTIFYLALLHGLAACIHQFFHKIPILSRMLPNKWV